MGREIASRLNGDGRNFDEAAANQARTARVELSGETLRVLVEVEGKRVVRAQRTERLPIGWSATDCLVEPEAEATRRYLGCVAVMVPLMTETEETSRRNRMKQERQRRGKKAQPLPPKKAGADQGYKEFKVVAFYGESQEHRLVCGTRGDREEAGLWMPRQARRIRPDLADEKAGNVDGPPWIRNQVRRQSLPQDDLGLDFCRPGVSVHETRREIYGDEGEAGKRWAGGSLPTFKHDG